MRRVLMLVVLAVLALPGPTQATEAMTAVATPGKGRLTLCRSWIVFRSCKSYDKVALPQQIAVGDRVVLNFGRNPKAYEFKISEIRSKGDGCLILSEHSGGAEDGERLDVSPCRPATE